MSDVSAIDQRDAAVSGGHMLPPRFSEALSGPPPARKRHPGLVWGIIGGVLVIATLTTLQLTSNVAYDAAEQQTSAAAEAAVDTRLTVAEANTELRGIADSASLILQSDTGALVDVAAKDTVTADVAVAEGTVAAAQTLLSDPIPFPGDKPGWFWELFAAASALDDTRQQIEQFDDRLVDEADGIDEAGSALTASGTAMLGSAAAAAAGHEAAHIAARNDDVIALREAAETASSIQTIDGAAVTAFTTLQSAAAQVVDSEAAELAEKAGPLLNARLEIEAFARSIAPGVLLDFDWAPIVNGVGYNGSMGGYTTWWWDDPGRATIELSDSVAEQWPADRSKALIVHEVGHAISVKCEDMYDSSTQDSIEKWATAWAISMGYTDDANGVWAYGYPPQSYIDAAAGCR